VCTDNLNAGVAVMKSALDGPHDSVEMLAEENRLHPKVVRQALRLAFLSPDVTWAILEGRQPKGLSLAQIPKLLPLSRAKHRPLLGWFWGDRHD
jgi:site-specific DNA recombinase